MFGSVHIQFIKLKLNKKIYCRLLNFKVKVFQSELIIASEYTGILQHKEYIP